MRGIGNYAETGCERETDGRVIKSHAWKAYTLTVRPVDPVYTPEQMGHFSVFPHRINWRQAKNKNNFPFLSTAKGGEGEEGADVVWA